MKTILHLLFSLLFVFSTINAQITLEGVDYFPVVGDTLVTAFDNTPEGISISASGGDQTWDFTALQSDATRTRIIQPVSEATNPDAFPSASAYIEQLAGGNGFYKTTEESFAIIGFDGEDPLGQGLEVTTPFVPPYVERWGTLAFFDNNNLNSSLIIAFAADDIPGNIFDGLPIAPDSLRVNVLIDRIDLVDGWGTMMIPGGTYDVLREKRTEIREIRLEAKVSIFPWVDVTDAAIDALPIDQLGLDTTVTYTHWSNDAKEPIAIITTSADESTITNVEFKFLDIINAVPEVIASKPRLNVYPNPAIAQAYFKFSNMPKGEYQLDIINMTGQLLLTKELNLDGDQLESINLSHLPKGLYMYSLRDKTGSYRMSNRISITKP